MQLQFRYHFLTFVLLIISASLVQGAPSNEILPPPVEYNPIKQQSEKSQNPTVHDSVQATDVPKTPFSGPITLSQISSIMTRVDVGMLEGVLKPTKDKSSAPYLGVSYIDYHPDFTSREWSLALTGDNIFLVQGSYRIFCCEERFQGAYYKGGVAGAFEAFDGLGNLINYQRYFALVAIGLDDLGKSHNRFGVEGSLLVGMSGIALSGKFSVAF